MKKSLFLFIFLALACSISVQCVTPSRYMSSWYSHSLEFRPEIRGLLEKYPTFFFCENLVDFNKARLPEAT